MARISDCCFIAIDCYCCCSSCTTMISIWTYYVRIANMSYWVTGDRGGGERGSTSWLCHSSWCEGFLVWLVEMSYALIIPPLRSKLWESLETCLLILLLPSNYLPLDSNNDQGCSGQLHQDLSPLSFLSEKKTNGTMVFLMDGWQLCTSLWFVTAVHISLIRSWMYLDHYTSNLRPLATTKVYGCTSIAPLSYRNFFLILLFKNKITELRLL